MLLVFSVLVSSSSTSSVLLVHLRLYKLYKHFGTTQLYTFKHLYMLYVCTGCTRLFTIYTIYHIPYIVYTIFFLDSSSQCMNHQSAPKYTKMYKAGYLERPWHWLKIHKEIYSAVNDKMCCFCPLAFWGHSYVISTTFLHFYTCTLRFD